MLLVTNLNLSFVSSLVYQFDFKGLRFDCNIYGFKNVLLLKGMGRIFITCSSTQLYKPRQVVLQ